MNNANQSLNRRSEHPLWYQRLLQLRREGAPMTRGGDSVSCFARSERDDVFSRLGLDPTSTPNDYAIYRVDMGLTQLSGPQTMLYFLGASDLLTEGADFLRESKGLLPFAADDDCYFAFNVDTSRSSEQQWRVVLVLDRVARRSSVIDVGTVTALIGSVLAGYGTYGVPMFGVTDGQATEVSVMAGRATSAQLALDGVPLNPATLMPGNGWPPDPRTPGWRTGLPSTRTQLERLRSEAGPAAEILQPIYEGVQSATLRLAVDQWLHLEHVDSCVSPIESLAACGGWTRPGLLRFATATAGRDTVVLFVRARPRGCDVVGLSKSMLARERAKPVELGATPEDAFRQILRAYASGRSVLPDTSG